MDAPTHWTEGGDVPRQTAISRRTAIVGITLAVVIGAIIAIGLRHRDAPVREVALTGTTPAPAVVGTDLKTGRRVDLADYRGKPVVINAWASWCNPCRTEAPHFVEFAKRHPEVQLLGLNMNNDRSDALEFLRTSGWTYPSIVDQEGAIGLDRLRIANLPTTLYVDARGVIRGRSPGEVTLQELESVAARIGRPSS